VILLDTSGLLSALFVDQRHHAECARVLREVDGPLVLSPFVLAELDYLVGKLAGVEAELRLLTDVSRGAYELATFTTEDVEHAQGLIGRFRDLHIGLADASLVVLADRLNARSILTLDARHFRALHGARGRPFRLLPFDS